MSFLRCRSVARTLVWLPAWARDAMVDAASEKEPDETGGVLLGYEVSNKRMVVVTDVVGPGPRARYSRARFEPDGRWQE